MALQSPEEFEQHMARLIWENRWKTPSALQVWTEKHMCRKGAAVFAAEHCVFADQFPRWFGNIIGNCDAIDARQYMIENMYVEEVLDPTITTGHYESMVDFAVALGHERDFIYGYKGRTYTRMALAYWDRASRAWPWLEAFAAVAGLEAARGPAVEKFGKFTKLNRAVFEPLGLDDKALAHWTAGEAADFPDGGHGDMTLKILAKHADTADKQAAVLEIIEETTRIRWFHFDHIGRDAMAASGVAMAPA